MTPTPPRQLPLELGHRPSLMGEDFLVSPCNAEAVAWLDRWPEWPGPGLIIHGPEGCGKTHLAQVFLARTGGKSMTACKFSLDDPAALIDDNPALVLENADRFLHPEMIDEVFHLYNMAKEQGRWLLLTAHTPPAQWDIGLADLKSRLLAMPSVAISAPDDHLLAALLVKQFSDRQLKVEAGVIDYMLARMERSFAQARTLVEATDTLALAAKRNITVPLVRDALFELNDQAGQHEGEK